MSPLAYRTCDLCRKRKTRCTATSPSDRSSRCVTCSRAGADCTFLNGYKKPGRPRISLRPTSSQAGQSQRAITTEEASDSGSRVASPRPLPRVVQHVTNTELVSGPVSTETVWPRSPQMAGDDLSFSFDFATANHDTVESLGSSSQVPLPHQSTSSTEQLRSGPVHAALDHSSRRSEYARYEAIAITSGMALDNVVPWTAISDVIAIFLCSSHSLFPLVHKPTFSQQLAMRKDRTDRSFAAVVLGIVAYTIAQSPLSRLTAAGPYTRQELYWIERRCHAASMVKLDRRYKVLSVNQVATLMCGHFCCKSMDQANQAAVLLAEACQLTHLLCLQSTENDDVDCIERELRRRLFWHVLAVDTTEASAGHIIHMNGFEGFAPLPLDIDDELITAQGVFEPVPGSYSSLTGFLAVVQLFPCMADCIARHRSLRQRQFRGHPLTSDEAAKELAWIASTRAACEAGMDSLPAYLKDPTWDGHGDDDWLAITAMQRANVWVTDSSLKFILLAYAEELENSADAIAEDRGRIERSVFRILSSLPLDALAANGESMRGKIFRIILDILRGNNPPEAWINPMYDWCDLYSRIQYVQLVSTDLVSLFPSRPHSPVAS